ncbi:hypothetical protein AtubIFM55763_002418 [Aspergillus tubingensis]|uniref:ankyrin repeat domain-containing protein n=1 Tax=Aspergillus tubingensis TaxID=5068 RepID=UPI001579F436|nr:ankyrin [Aspergillus tubingensis]GFN17604.1 ankyrin [Aspergillus tubingensis]GLA71911.1 hypothetical protein AtubIFM55763_002418 [Aspergillus tubingensis]GLA98805.1 hypothetical protein AtubIFM57143_007102 [Aspergillus tubingensis]GLB13910.1 hypothetical protein AtubIFM61612_001323 [Aspergillus tubingensis]
MRLIWNHSLPWLQFAKLPKPGRDHNLPSLSSALAATSPQSPGALTNNINRDLMQRLGSIIPWKTLSHPPNINSLSRIVTGLSILMPEEFGGQHRTLATRLCNTLRTTPESLNLELFLLSNGYVSHGPTGKSKRTMAAHDRNVMKLFHASGWKTMKHIETLLSTREPTAEGHSRETVASALRLLVLDKLGKCEGRRTALQHAVNNGNMDLINFLLDHGANVNSAPSENGGATALQIAAIQGYLGIARKLIDLDADVNAAPAQSNGRTALEGAAEHGRIDMLRLLLDEGASLVGNDGERQYRRAVELAEKNGHMAAAKLLKSFKDQVEESGI